MKQNPLYHLKVASPLVLEDQRHSKCIAQQILAEKSDHHHHQHMLVSNSEFLTFDVRLYSIDGRIATNFLPLSSMFHMLSENNNRTTILDIHTE